jgi:hypothetical protein
MEPNGQAKPQKAVITSQCSGGDTDTATAVTVELFVGLSAWLAIDEWGRFNPSLGGYTFCMA